MHVIFRNKDRSITIQKDHWSDRKYDMLEKDAYMYNVPMHAAVELDREMFGKEMVHMDYKRYMFNRKYLNEYDERVVIYDEI
jgi:stalled ribosome rescue protein Dom34